MISFGNGFLFHELCMANAAPVAVACAIEAANTSMPGKIANKFIYIEFLLKPPSTKMLLASVPFNTNWVEAIAGNNIKH